MLQDSGEMLLVAATICENYLAENNELERVKYLLFRFQLEDNVEVSKCVMF